MNTDWHMIPKIKVHWTTTKKKIVLPNIYSNQLEEKLEFLKQVESNHYIITIPEKNKNWATGIVTWRTRYVYTVKAPLIGHRQSLKFCPLSRSSLNINYSVVYTSIPENVRWGSFHCISNRLLSRRLPMVFLNGAGEYWNTNLHKLWLPLILSFSLSFLEFLLLLEEKPSSF